MTKLKFEELNLSTEILNAVKDMGFEEASPIQSDAIPIIMQGKDIIGQAQTGTGKTAAFAIPVIEKINTSSKQIQALILCPTRELVIQVADEFRKLMKYKENLSVIPIYGGQPIERQLRALKNGAQIVIGTPGRTMDHMRRGSINISELKILVLDEADEMLDMGFREDIEIIINDTPAERQTVLFSATMAKEIKDLAAKYQNNPEIINVSHQKLSKPKIHQVYFELLEKNKPEVLARLIDMHNIKLAVVFCNTKSQVDQLVEILKTRGYFADALHGDMSQNFRDKVMNGFRNGAVEILVATDVAGRGIDVSNVEAVFNYDLPRDDEDYIHRIGRTGRAGKTGLAFTFIVGKQIYNLKRIERMNGMQIHRQNIPTMDELEATKISFYASKVSEIIEQGHLSKYVNQVEQLMGEDYSSLDVAAALLKMALEKENQGFDNTIDLEPPVKYNEENRPSRSRNRNNRGFSRSSEKDSNFRREKYKKENSSKFDFKKSKPQKDDFKKEDFKFISKKPKKKKDFANEFFKQEEPFKNKSVKTARKKSTGKTKNY